MDLDSIPFVQARWFYPGRTAAVDLIVLHDMEAPETLHTAEDTARYFQAGTVRASAHYCVDGDSIVGCVKPDDTAFQAPSANANGIGIEHAGYARQSRSEWLDAYGLAMLDLSAQLTAALCLRYKIPVVYLNETDLGSFSRPRGITTHRATTFAYHIQGGHTDPGEFFPMDWYIGRVQFHLGGDTEMPLSPSDIEAVAQRVAQYMTSTPNPLAQGEHNALDALNVAVNDPSRGLVKRVEDIAKKVGA